MILIRFLAISGVILALIPIVLIISQRPKEMSGDMAGGMQFSSVVERGIADMPEPTLVPTRSGWAMPVRDFGGADASKPLLILIHGSGWNGLQFSHLANALKDASHVLVPDLRGHGANPERRGDVDYIGQMEDDLADLIAAKRLKGQKVVIAGHSSGGGLVVRFAGGTHGALMDEAVLLAPFLKFDAPATKANSGGWAHLLLRRVIGLAMLNTARITALNHLTIIQFNMPSEVLNGPYGDLATTAYSFRLNTGFAPRLDYLSDVAALPKFTLVVGSDDEAFYADRYEQDMRAVTDKGTFKIVPGVDHLGIVDHQATVAALKAALK